MVMQVNNTDSANVRTLQIESKQLLPNVLPTLAIGDIINVTVRQNSEQGQGLIYFKGLLVKANLPKNVSVGDRLLAKLTESNNQVVLRILEQTKGLPAATLDITPEILNDLHELLKQQPMQGLKAPATLQFSDALLKALQVEEGVQNLFHGIPSLDKLHDARITFEQLVKAADGTSAESLKAMANSIKQFVEKHSPNESQRNMIALRENLEKLLTDLTESNEDSSELLGKLSDTLQQTLKDRSKPIVDRDNTRQLIAKLHSRPTVNLAGFAGEIRESVQATLGRLNAEISTFAAAGLLDKQTANDLLQVATRFEQMAQTQEVLAKLNPVMQSLGEPALILFPYLFQGLINHSEVTIETKFKVRREEEEQDGGRGKSAEPFQRIQVTVPLPSMGPVDVDIAHRTSEILVRFTVQEKAVSDFILEELEKLAPILKNLGFERAEMVAQAGQRHEILPAWSFGLHSATTVIA